MSITERPADDRFIVTCQKPQCYLSVAVWTLESAVELEKHHDCPVSGGETHYAGSITMMLLEQMWVKIDTAYAELATVSDEATAKSLQGICRGMAEMIVLFMTPFFRSSDEVVREVVKRYKAKQAGEEYESPGLGHRKYEAVYDFSPEHLATVAAKRAVVAAAERSTGTGPVVLPAADVVEKIKEALASKMFKPQDLANVFEVSVDVVNAIAKQ